MEELKPCPFCAGKAYLYVKDGVRVQCGDCNASTKVLVDGWNVNKPTGNATLGVISAWNKRIKD